MSGIGNQDPGPFEVSPIVMVTPDHKNSGQFALSARGALQGKTLETGNGLEAFLEFIDERDCPLGFLCAKKRMGPPESLVQEPRG